MQSRIKALDKKEKLGQLDEIKTLDFEFRSEPFSAKWLLTAEDLAFSFSTDALPLIQGLTLSVGKKDRIGIIGKNGKGKTTFLNLLAGELTPQNGEVKHHANLRLAYFGQTNIDRLDPKKTALERNWRGPLLSNSDVDVTLAQFQALEKAATPRDRKNWRFQQALFRAYYDAYTFTNCSNSASCLTVNLDHPGFPGGSGLVQLFASAYLGSFNPASITSNYIADSGLSDVQRDFTFTATPGQTYVVVVSEVNSGAAASYPYTLTIDGLCAACQTYTTQFTCASCPTIPLTPASLPTGTVGLPYS